jgi:hypothetical protein
VATLATYDQRADAEINHRQSAATKEPLAVRSVVWAQSDAGDGAKEVLPWSRPSAPTPQPTKTSAVNEGAGMPWYMQWLSP